MRPHPRASALLALRVVTLAALTLCAAIAHAATRPTNGEIYFRLDNPCPATGRTIGACKGYVIDRIIPRRCGGADEPSNMQWQTIAEARAKNRWDRIGCRGGRKLVLPGQDPPFTEARAIGEPVAPVEAEPLPAQ